MFKFLKQLFCRHSEWIERPKTEYLPNNFIRRYYYCKRCDKEFTIIYKKKSNERLGGY